MQKTNKGGSGWKTGLLVGIAVATFGLTCPGTSRASDFTYTIDNNEITITGYTGVGGAVEIPSIIQGKPVTIIGDEAFQSCLTLTSVTIPDSVTTIEGRDEGAFGAFRHCINLTSVMIGNGVTSIGTSAFRDCLSLTSVVIGNKVTSIGTTAFRDCTSLTSVTIPGSVTSIGEGAFANTGLTSVTIPNSVTSIGTRAFANTGLTSVTIPDSVTSIGDSAFHYCDSLTGVYFKGNAPTYEENIFDSASNLAVYYISGTTGWGETFAGRPTAIWSGAEPIPVPVYRFYSSGASESTYTHLWTINTTERDTLMTYPSWQFEGIGWYALTNAESGTVPLYRLYEPNIRRHLYTINATEYVDLDGGSWNGENKQYFVYPTNSVSGTIPAYRFYHSVNQNHHFTISENEKDTINANPDWGYNYEGIAFYVFQTNAPSSLRRSAAIAKQKANQTALVSEYTHAGAGVQDSVFYEEQIATKHDIRYNPQTERWYLISETEQGELIPVPGDYSGNGIEDLVLYEEATGNWFILQNEPGFEISDLKFEIAPLAQWGGPGFVPVSGDFNKDGISDLAVYHEDTGTWYITTVDGKILVWGLELDESVFVE